MRGGGDDVIVENFANQNGSGGYIDGNDILNGGDGVDTLSFDGLSREVTVSLLAGTASSSGTGNDTISNFENVIGGNQSDSVSLAWIRKDRLVAARWPASVPPPLARAPILVARNEALSWNEG